MDRPTDKPTTPPQTTQYQTTPAQKRVARPYQKPTLTVYGDLAELTQIPLS